MTPEEMQQSAGEQDPRDASTTRDTQEPLTDEDLPEADIVEEAGPPRELTLEEQVIALQEECAGLREKSLRAQADYQNQKRRTFVERDMEVRRRLQPLLTELLLVLDFLDMALLSPATNEETKNLAMGVDMTRTRFLQTLENANVTPIVTEGIFDPNQHEATETEEVEGKQPGTILRTVRRGYEWNSVVLRHAQVVVVAGGETPAIRTAPAAGTVANSEEPSIEGAEG